MDKHSYSKVLSIYVLVSVILSLLFWGGFWGRIGIINGCIGVVIYIFLFYKELMTHMQSITTSVSQVLHDSNDSIGNILSGVVFPVVLLGLMRQTLQVFFFGFTRYWVLYLLIGISLYLYLNTVHKNKKSLLSPQLVSLIGGVVIAGFIASEFTHIFTRSSWRPVFAILIGTLASYVIFRMTNHKADVLWKHTIISKVFFVAIGVTGLGAIYSTVLARIDTHTIEKVVVESIDPFIPPVELEPVVGADIEKDKAQENIAQENIAQENIVQEKSDGLLIIDGESTSSLEDILDESSVSITDSFLKAVGEQ